MNKEGINYNKVRETELYSLEYITLEKLKTTLINVDIFLKDKFDLGKYQVILFAGGFEMHNLSDDSPIYKYRNGQFTLKKGIIDIKTLCLLIYGGDKAVTIIL